MVDHGFMSAMDPVSRLTGNVAVELERTRHIIYPYPRCTFTLLLLYLIYYATVSKTCIISLSSWLCIILDTL